MGTEKLLHINEVATMLNVSVEVLSNWVESEKFPCQSIDGKMSFCKEEILRWQESHLESAQKRLSENLSMSTNAKPRPGRSLFDFIKRGGVHYNIAGKTIGEVLENSMAVMPLPSLDIDRSTLTDTIKEREKIITTAIGRGVAIPHTRTPVLNSPDDERVGLFFLRNPVDFRALDRMPVSTLFIMLSCERRTHLQILQRIGYFCSQRAFTELLERRASQSEILEYLDVHRQIIE